MGMHIDFLELYVPDSNLESVSEFSLILNDPDRARYVAQNTRQWTGFGYYQAALEWRFPYPGLSD